MPSDGDGEMQEGNLSNCTERNSGDLVNACSSLASIAVINNTDQKQLGGRKGLLAYEFQAVI